MAKRKCKQCKNFVSDFVTVPAGTFCSMEHAITFVCEAGKKKREKLLAKTKKDFNSKTRRMKNAIKSRSDWLKECQQVFNKFIRERDSHSPCISCGRHHSGQYHAGHYKSVGSSPELRFNESNCHKQCAPCNNHLSGNISSYRPNLIRKVGAEKVAELEGPHEPKKYTIEELKELKKVYQAKYKLLNEGN